MQIPHVKGGVLWKHKAGPEDDDDDDDVSASIHIQNESTQLFPRLLYQLPAPVAYSPSPRRPLSVFSTLAVLLTCSIQPGEGLQPGDSENWIEFNHVAAFLHCKFLLSEMHGGVAAPPTVTGCGSVLSCSREPHVEDECVPLRVPEEPMQMWRC